MYASRFTKWGWDKNRKEDEMVFILQKTAERAAAGKKTAFQVRGRIVSQKDVAKYFARKGGVPSLDPEDGDRNLPLRPVTPPNLRYRTPTPLPRKAKLEDVEIESSKYSKHGFPRTRKLLHSKSDSYSSATYDSDSTMDHLDPQAIPEGYSLSYIPAEDLQRSPFFTKVPQDPAPIQFFRLSEELLYNINTYFDGSFSSGTWQYSETSKDCVNINHGIDTTRNNGRFLDACRMSITLIKDKKYIEARRMLSRACELVQAMLSKGHPRTVSTFLEIFLWLKREGFDEVTNLIRNYLSEMAAAMLSGNHPLARICNLIAMVDGDVLEEAMVQSWKCTNDAFAKHLGRFSETTLHSYLTWVRWVYRPTNPKAEELILRELLADSSSVLDPRSPSSLSIQFKIGTNLMQQEQWDQCESIGKRFLARVKESGPSDDRIVIQNIIQGLGLIATSQFNLGKLDSATTNMRAAVDLVAQNYGRTDPHVARKLTTIEGWLREFGKIEEANKVKLEIEKLIELDDTDANA